MHAAFNVGLAALVLGSALAVRVQPAAHMAPEHPVAKRPCAPKSHAGSFLAKATNISANATVAAAAKGSDPTCKTGLLSLPGTPKADGPQVCCPSYCGECSDYPTCSSVDGQNSKNACCASAVLALSCGGGAPANTCLKKCSETHPPCIMEDGEVFEMPNKTTAGEDCNEAVGEWEDSAENAIKSAPGGEEQWEELKRKGVVFHNNTPAVVALDKDMKTAMLVAVQRQVDPCGSIECGALRCPGGFTEEKVAGHCCGYCVNPNIKVEAAVKGASGEFGGKPSTFCNDVWCFPTMCTKEHNNPTTTNGQCCPACPAF